MLPAHTCTSCHTIAAPDDHYCANCGAQLTRPHTTTESDFVPLDVVPTFEDPEPTGFRRFTERLTLPRHRHG